MRAVVLLSFNRLMVFEQICAHNHLVLWSQTDCFLYYLCFYTYFSLLAGQHSSLNYTQLIWRKPKEALISHMSAKNVSLYVWLCVCSCFLCVCNPVHCFCGDVCLIMSPLLGAFFHIFTSIFPVACTVFQILYS